VQKFSKKTSFFPPHPMANLPYKNYRLGALSVSIFRNERKDTTGKDFITYSATASKRYLSGDKWLSTNSFNMDELPVIASLIERAYMKHIEE